MSLRLGAARPPAADRQSQASALIAQLKAAFGALLRPHKVQRPSNPQREPRRDPRDFHGDLFTGRDASDLPAALVHLGRPSTAPFERPDWLRDAAAEARSILLR